MPIPVPLSAIPVTHVTEVLEAIPVTRLRPAFLIRKPDPSIKGPQWHKLRPEEVPLVKEFLAKLKRDHPVNIRVTPELAAALLVCFNWHNPRKFRQTWAIYLTYEMLDGHWGDSNDNICFNLDLTFLANGQHRFAAIEASGIAQVVTIKLVTDEAIANMDQGMRRQTFEVTDIPKKFCPYARFLNEVVTRTWGKTSPTLNTEIYETYQEGMDFIDKYKTLQKRGAGVSATLAFCWVQLENNKAAREKLKQFVYKLDTELGIERTDIARITLNYLGTVGGRHDSSLEIFYKICFAAKAVIDDMTHTRLSSNPAASDWFKEINPAGTQVFKALKWPPDKA